jgi:hypothetical protein
MKRALMKFLSQPTERHWFVQVLLDEPANGLYNIGFAVAAPRAWAAAQASAISRLLGSIGRGEELNIPPPWTPRRARWPAIHARR